MMRTTLDPFFIRRTVGLLTIVLGICACTDNRDKPVDVGVQPLSEEMLLYATMYRCMP